MALLNFLAVLISLITSAQAQISVVNQLNDAQRKELEMILAGAMKNQKMPSIAVAATRGSYVFWADAVGYADVEEKRLADPYSTMYRWASVSKLATARIAISLAENGQLNLDASIGNGVNSEYYPLLERAKVMRRCFTQTEMNRYAVCMFNYGNPNFFAKVNGTCFEPKTFDTIKTSKEFLATIVDKTSSMGNVVFKDGNDKDKCRLEYSIATVELESSDDQITLRKLLAHKGGIQHYSHLNRESEPPTSLIGDAEAVKHRKENGISQMAWAVTHFYPKHPLLAIPGALDEYSTYGYNLAGVVIERAVNKNFDRILKSYTDRFGGVSIQPDYLAIPSVGTAPGNIPYRKTANYDLIDGKISRNVYDTDNSYKLAGGGIMSNIVDLARFCVAITNDGWFTAAGAKTISHSGAHPNRTKTLLVAKANQDNNPQCLVLMTNINHKGIDLEDLRKKVEAKFIAWGLWKTYP